MKITYEWVWELLDETTTDVLECLFDKQLFPKPWLGKPAQLALVFSIGDEIDGAADIQYAYVVDGKLPAAFDGGRRVPNYKKNELLHYQKAAEKNNPQ